LALALFGSLVRVFICGLPAVNVKSIHKEIVFCSEKALTFYNISTQLSY